MTAPLGKSKTIPAPVLSRLASDGFALERSSDGKSFVVATHGCTLSRDPATANAVGAMTSFVERLVRDKRRIRNMCCYLPDEACRAGVADQILRTSSANNGKVEGIHNIAANRVRTATGQVVHVAFDPTARGFIFGGDSGPAEAETIAFVAGSRRELGQMLEDFFGGSFTVVKQP
jgi:hypothetical protein